MTTAATPDGIDEAGAARATVDLLGVLAYGELSAFDRLSEDARTAPTLSGRATLSKIAAAEMGHFVLLEEHLLGMGVAVEDAMVPFVAAWDSYHASTAPRPSALKISSLAPVRSSNAFAMNNPRPNPPATSPSPRRAPERSEI